MHLNREENYKYRKLAITVLSKALDDICPTFENEPEAIRKKLIKERIKTFKVQEKELDKEWREMEVEACNELKEFKKYRDKIFIKIERTVKTKRIKLKVKELQHKKQSRIEYLNSKLTQEEETSAAKLLELQSNSKKYVQVEKKLEAVKASITDKIRKAEIRYNTIINNTLNSDNSKKVEERLKQSREVWGRKYDKLKKKFNDREEIHNNKRFECDQIRLSLQGFIERKSQIFHWCEMSGLTVKSCYASVKERILLIEREVPELIEELSNLKT